MAHNGSYSEIFEGGVLMEEDYQHHAEMMDNVSLAFLIFHLGLLQLL